ncbi:MAG TPA: ROK family protein, partial [Acidobacteriota bacterium]
EAPSRRGDTAMSVLGVDVGAGAIKFAVFAESAQTPLDGGLQDPLVGDLQDPQRGHSGPLYRAEEKTARSYPELKAQLLGIVARLQRPHDIRAVGIGVPGFISCREHIVELSPNMLFLNGVALEKDIADGCGLPVRLENDANAAALGEYLGLDEPRPASFIHLTLGSGIGSGIILDGRGWQGACGFAAELGHLLVNSRGRACGCGNSGCAETESSEAGIVKSYQEYAGSSYPLSSRDVFHLLQKGDESAQRAFQRAGGFLGILFSQIVYALNPECISIGGGVAAAGEALLGPAREELSRRVIAKAFACTRIQPARLGNAAGMAGAAALASGRLS